MFGICVCLCIIYYFVIRFFFFFVSLFPKPTHFSARERAEANPGVDLDEIDYLPPSTAPANRKLVRASEQSSQLFGSPQTREGTSGAPKSAAARASVRGI